MRPLFAGTWHGADGAPFSVFLVRASLVFAFLSLALLGLNAFPHGFIYAPYPERPAYVLSLAGMTCYALSLRWAGQWREHKVLLALVGLSLLYGLCITLAGAAHLGGGGLYDFAFFNYLYRKVFPSLYILWFAFLLSPMEERAQRRFFIAALLVLFILNAPHMILENLANFGREEIKDFLVSINPWFRTENTSHDNWPPAYYVGRVRGLFAEPSHLAFAFIPLLGYFFFKAHKRLIFLLPLLLLAFSYIWKIPTMTGLVSLGGFLAAFVLRPFLPLIAKRPRTAGVILTGVAACGFFCLTLLPQWPQLTKDWQEAGRIAAYCEQAWDDPAAEPPVLSGRANSRFFTRMASMRLEMTVALAHPWGTGYFLGGLYREPLRVWESQPQELFLYMRYAFAKPVPVMPHLCEYSALAAELGFPSLLLFLALCFYVGRLAWKRYALEQDLFFYYMAVSVLAFMAALFSCAMKSGFMFYYFLGFLYAVSHSSLPHGRFRAKAGASN